VKREHTKVLVAILLTYLVLSFVPQLGLLNLLHGFSGKTS
jgi:hypothetical protein